ncbi:MAG: cyclodeaminase/cyclohydrolase family protein [Peptococcaceae bacterium]|nr:cyclodeaminase/cyclohydrolase family protein [Peptococcaceae bacterium]
MKDIMQWTLKQVLDKAASSDATPGGGSVAALTGSLAVSMVSMVASLTIGKERYAGVESQCRNILGKTRSLGAEFENLMKADMAAFENLMACFKMPRSSEEEKQQRQKAVQEAVKNCIEVPMAIARASVTALRLAGQVASIGNKNAISDAGVAVYLADAALGSALLNVDINLPMVKDETYARQVRYDKKELEQQAAKLKVEGLKIVNQRLGK